MDHVDETREQTCYEKAKAKGEPTFTLRSQDSTADLVVDFWTMVQMRVQYRMWEKGETLMEAVNEVRIQLGVPVYPPVLHDRKLDGAARIAEAMRQWPARRLAN